MPDSSLGRTVISLVAVALLLGGLFWWLAPGRQAGASVPVYVALGASDAVGIGADRPASEGWVPLLLDSLPGGTQLVNLGVNGATLEQVLRLQLPVALDAHPSWVSLWPGVNDLRAGVPLATFAQQLNAILDQLTAAGQAPKPAVALLNIPDLRLLPAFGTADPVRLDQTVHQWNQTIAEAAARHGATLVDLYAVAPEFAQHPEYVSGDGFHPSGLGYRRIAELTIAALKAREGAGLGAMNCAPTAGDLFVVGAQFIAPNPTSSLVPNPAPNPSPNWSRTTHAALRTRRARPQRGALPC